MKPFFLLASLLFIVSCSQVKLVSNDDELPEMKKGNELVSLDGISIRQGYLNLLADINPRIKSQLENPVTRKQLVNNLIDQELMYQESLKRGLQKEKKVKEKAALYKRVIISQALLDNELEKEARKHYEEKKDNDFTKVEIAQIQVDFKRPEEKPEAKPDEKTEKKAAKEETAPTPEEKQATLNKAGEIRARLLAGEDFAKLAEELSDDKISRKKGGSMGSVSRDDKRLARRGLQKAGELAFQLKKGEISEPIESEKGYHIIKVLSDPQVTPLEEAEKTIRFQIQRQVKDDFLASLRKKAKITYTDKSLEEQSKKQEPARDKEPQPQTTEPGSTPPPTATAPESPGATLPATVPAPEGAQPPVTAPAQQPPPVVQPPAPTVPATPPANPNGAGNSGEGQGTGNDEVFYKGNHMRIEDKPAANPPATQPAAEPQAQAPQAPPAPAGNVPMGNY